MCLFPKNVKITLKDGSQHYMTVPCGKCIECLQLRTHDWEFRMKNEKLSAQMSVFVTLTYNDEFLPQQGVQVSHLQKFIKKLRRYGIELRYFGIGEYGTQFQRPHYHVILFIYNQIKYYDLLMRVNQAWQFGFTQIKTVTAGRIHYCIAYLIGQKKIPNKNKPFCLMSKRPPIGSNLLKDEDFVQQLKKNDFKFVYRNGKKVHCPRFYKKKLKEDDFKPFNLIEIYCNKCQDEYRRKLDYLRTHDVFDRFSFLRCSPHFDFNTLLPAIANDMVTYANYVKSENANKDFVLKQRSKKLRND